MDPYNFTNYFYFNDIPKDSIGDNVYNKFLLKKTNNNNNHGTAECLVNRFRYVPVYDRAT